MLIWRFSRFWPLLVFFLSSFSELTVSGGAELNVIVENGTRIHIKTRAGIDAQCEVCIRKVCQSSVVLRSDTRLDFSCSEPENVFTVEIIRDTVINIEPKEHKTFLKFTRTFIWNLKPPVTGRIILDFNRTGLRQIQPTDGCPDKHVYMITTENVTIGRFCQKGPIKQVEVLNVVKLSLEVSGGQTLDTNVIGVSLGRLTNKLAYIVVVLPERSLTQDFFTPNTFPEETRTLWLFIVPQTFYVNVHILNHTVPTCLQPENIPKMNYNWVIREPQVKPLNGIQPLEMTGNFGLFIKNCNISRPSQDLMVHFQISTDERTKGQCKGVLPKNQMLQIRVKWRFRSDCLLRLDSVNTNTVTIASGKHYILDTFDCDEDELELTVTQTIECKEWGNCVSTPFPLTFYYKPQCIKGVLKTITWHLHGPQNSAVELQSPPDGLRYCPSEDKSSSILLLDVSHVNPGIIVGQFCPKGTIEKIQIRESKIAVTASVTSFSDRNLATKPFLTYSFTQEISENYIFTVSPKMDNPTVLVTPTWPSGMKPSSTVSWIINTELKSNLKFRIVSQPKCEEEGNTNIAVQTIQSQTVVYSTKKDENINDVLVPESFYLNMTNCKSPTGAFRAMMEITLPNNKLLGIILSIVGIVLMIITAMAIWIVLRKKKRNKALPVSVCNPNAFLPGLHGIPRTQEGEDPHTYEYIDDSLVYSHLLKGNAEQEQCTDESSPPLPDRPLRKSVTEGSEMVDNELYGHTQRESTTSGSPKSPIKTSEEGANETRLCA